MSSQLRILFCSNLRRRFKDGFAFGYNIIFPAILVLLLGVLCKGSGADMISSYSYYVITIIPFCAAMGIVTASYACKNDAYENAAVRILSAPVRKIDITLGIVLSVTLVIGLCSAMVYLVFAIIFHMPVLPDVILFYLMFSFCICSLGGIIGFCMKNFMVVKNIMSIPIGIFAVAAGTFYPIHASSEVLRRMIQLSPFTWINRVLFLSEIDGVHEPLWLMTFILFSLGVVFTAITIKIFKKEEFIHGSLPGYEK